ncbi:hypothetical protein ANCCEY_09403 [Ancylostoma ceylanicum]|uniref:Uncharacterized protein n=1 Tax=Ancylostoma ceylanicum TaxID=53326 RepID=A0A0D6LHP6_9BILA|nr:hypothetical protein ANCCEY_09403 [Ancylostoma ceylanicum]
MDDSQGSPTVKSELLTGEDAPFSAHQLLTYDCEREIQILERDIRQQKESSVNAKTAITFEQLRKIHKRKFEPPTLTSYRTCYQEPGTPGEGAPCLMTPHWQPISQFNGGEELERKLVRISLFSISVIVFKTTKMFNVNDEQSHMPLILLRRALNVIGLKITFECHYCTEICALEASLFCFTRIQLQLLFNTKRNFSSRITSLLLHSTASYKCPQLRFVRSFFINPHLSTLITAS